MCVIHLKGVKKYKYFERPCSHRGKEEHPKDTLYKVLKKENEQLHKHDVQIVTPK